MSNKNYPSNNYQLPDDSFLYNLDVNDWSMLAHPEETDQPDDDRGVGGEPRQFDQEQQSEPEAKVAIEPTRTKDEGEMVGATETLEVKAVPGLAREQVIAEVALAGQVGQTAQEEEKANTPWIELEEAEERAMELREQKANLNAVVLFVVMLALMESQEQEANSDKPHVERLVDDPDWQELGEQTGNKVRAEMMEMMEVRASAAYNKYLRSSDGSKRDIKQERALATKHADDAYGLVKQLYANPGWSPDELLQKELLRLDIEESPDKAQLAETLDTVHDLFGVGRDGHGGHVGSHDISRIAQRDLPRDGLSDLEQYFAEHGEHKDSGCAGVIALYHLRKKLRDDEPIKKILQIADSGSEAEVTGILNDTDKSGDVVDYEQKLETIDRMVEQVDQYFDGAEVKESFTIDTLGVNDEEDALYRWAVVRNAEYKVACLSEDELRRNTERYADSATIYGWILAWGGKNLFEMADQIHDKDVKARERRKAKSSRTA